MLRTAFQKVGAYSVLSGRAGYKGGVFVVGRRQLNSEAIAALSQEEWKAKWTEAVKDIRADLGECLWAGCGCVWVSVWVWVW
eukprot:Pgem_evm1s10106